MYYINYLDDIIHPCTYLSSYEVETDPMLTTIHLHQIRNPKGIKIWLHAILNVLVETLIFVGSKEHQGVAKKAYTVN